MARHMKVILLHEVAGLGSPGDVKDVAPGYARNYLLPRQLVTLASASEMANLRDRIAAARRRVEKQAAEHASLSQRLAAVTLTFAVRVGQGGRLYGSVTNQDIANALQEQEHLTVDRRIIQLREPLRQLGSFEVPLRVAPKVEPKVKVNIISNEEAAQAAAAGATPATEASGAPATPDATGTEA
ncbi:MAG: 50S ribosomal protein L9 [Ktedonobacterales bacterium]